MGRISPPGTLVGFTPRRSARLKKQARMDPSEVLDAASLLHLFASLDVRSLGTSLLVSKAWQALAVHSPLWHRHCQELWSDKVYVPQHIREEPNKLVAYSRSIADSTRTKITEEELVTYTWNFQFRPEMQSFWGALVGDAPLKRYFHADRSMTSPVADPLTLDTGGYRWEFRKWKEGVKGCYVQVNQYPSLEPTRLSNWGWQMHNMWVIFIMDASTPNPGIGKEPVVEFVDDPREDSDSDAPEWDET